MTKLSVVASRDLYKQVQRRARASLARRLSTTHSERHTVFPGNAYVVRPATEDDQRALQRLAELDGQRPFAGPALIGEINGRPAAAVSLFEGRVVADPFQPTAALRQVLRMRRGALRAYSSTPSLADRMRAAMQPFAAAHAGAA